MNQITDLDITGYALELIFKRRHFDEMDTISKAEDATRYLRDRIEVGILNHKEYVWVILLTQANRVLGHKMISAGKTSATSISFKEIAQVALLSNACALILIHNHPSGQLKPSSADFDITKKAKKVLNLVDTMLLDHIIVTQEGYYSFSDDGHLTS